jgi:Capsule polysaccharide biosynthesis protein
MRVLFQPIYLETPHFETELELMADHLDAGDEVYVLACRGELATCFSNYQHEAWLCAQCQARFTKGLGLLDGRIHVVPYPFPPQARYAEVPDDVADFEALKRIQVGAAEIGLGAASSLCTRFNTHHVDTIRYQAEVATELNTAYYVYQVVTRVLRDVNPDLVYLFNGRFSAVLPALNACEELGVAYATHERGGTRDRYWVINGTLPHDIDRASLEVERTWGTRPEAEARRLGSAFFVDRRNRVEQSWHVYAAGQTRDALPDRFDSAMWNIAIFNSTLEEVAALRGWPRPLTVYPDETEAIARICGAFEADPARHVYLRVHPNLRGCDNAQTRGLQSLAGRFANLTIVAADAAVDSYALMERSDAILTFGSTMGVEACFWGRPSILLGRAYYENLDCAYRPGTHEDVVRLLQSPLAPKPRTEAMKYGLWEHELGSPFRRYKAESLIRGTFNGARINDLE